ncbi:MAG TPA: CBS domain-containing protein [Pseudorhodoplanes sp.]|jgi:CBS domain-containing protein|nr:CBS domain-containing protein [Pseudorhodoplanes sp.]
MNVNAILSKKGASVVTIEPTATLGDAARRLAEHRIGALVVTGAEGRVVGILSERDVVRAIAGGGAAAMQTPLTEAMTRKVVTCKGSDTITSLMEQMTDGKFRHLPVVDGDRLAGIISIGDVVKYRLWELEQEQNALRDYIQTA